MTLFFTMSVPSPDKVVPNFVAAYYRTLVYDRVNIGKFYSSPKVQPRNLRTIFPKSSFSVNRYSSTNLENEIFLTVSGLVDDTKLFSQNFVLRAVNGKVSIVSDIVTYFTQEHFKVSETTTYVVKVDDSVQPPAVPAQEPKNDPPPKQEPAKPTAEPSKPANDNPKRGKGRSSPFVYIPE